MKRRAMVVVALLGLGAAAWLTRGWWAGREVVQSGAEQPVRAPSGIPVSVAKVAVGDVPVILTGLGTVRPLNSALVTSRVDGQIVKVNFIEGQMVKAGDVLVELDPRPYRAALEQAEATRAKDQAQLDSALLDLDRAQRLSATGSGTAKQYDLARALVAQFEASIKADSAAIAAVQVQLDYCQIRAPFDGRSGTRQIDAGNIVRANSATGIVTINQIQPTVVEFNLVADTLPQIRSRMRAGDLEVVASDRDDHELGRGKLAVIDNQVNPGTGTIRYRATFANTDEALWPGQFVNVRLLLDTQHNVLTVPTTAVVRDDIGPYVFVIDKASVAHKQPVTIGTGNNKATVIAQGVSEGDVVVSDGQYRIQAGAKVSAVAPPAAPARPTN